MIFIAFNLNGCGKGEIDDLATATAIGLDKTEEGKFRISIQVLNVNAVGKDAKDMSPVVVISEEATTIQEALRKMTTFLTHKLFFSHFQVLLIGEDLAKDGIEPYLNFFAINTESLHGYNIAVVQGDTAENLLKMQTLLNFIPSIAIDGKLKAALKNYGTSKETIMDDVLCDLRTKGLGLSLGSLMIIGDVEEGSKQDVTKSTEAKNIVKTSTIAVFKKDKLLGYLNERESIGFSYITNEIKTSVVVASLKSGLVSIEVNQAKTKLSVKIENDVPKIKISVKLIGNITEDLSGQTKFTNEYVSEVSKKASYEVKKIIEESIDKAKEYNSDIFNFISLIHKKETDYWKTIYEDYDNVFPNIEVEINVTTSITRIRP